MKIFAVVVLIVQALALQGATAQCIRTASNLVAASPVLSSCGCGCTPGVTSPVVTTGPTTVVQVPSVASSLADTLSLLTVSSLLAETLPLGSAVVAGVPVGPCGAWNSPLAGTWGGCGCGAGCGTTYGTGYGYGLGYNVLL